MDIDKCPRCQGLIIDDMFLCETYCWLYGFRCVNCGWVKLQDKVIDYANNKTAGGSVNRMDELELYRTRSRRFINNRDNVQHKQILRRYTEGGKAII